MKSFIIFSLFFSALGEGAWALPSRVSSLPLSLKEFGARIINGQEVKPMEYSSMCIVSLLTSDGSYFCGGTLIKDNLVITAAHCCPSNVKEYTILAGVHNLWDPNESTRVLWTFGPERVTVHPQWNMNSLAYDVAIINLTEKAPPCSGFIPASIPSPDMVGQSFDGEDVKIVGWGRTTDSSQDLSPVLLEGKTVIIPQSTCKNWWSPYLQSCHICTSSSIYGQTCNGDSGGPLFWVDRTTQQEYVIGSVSFGDEKCESNTPPVYASYLDKSIYDFITDYMSSST